MYKNEFDDKRYQSLIRLKSAVAPKAKSGFTFYDNKDIMRFSAAKINEFFQSSNKKIGPGELLNKILDIIIMFDKAKELTLSPADTVYYYRYALFLRGISKEYMYDKNVLSSFDNRFKSSIINSRIFAESFPSKYTIKTNFSLQKVYRDVVADVLKTYEEYTLPKLYKYALSASKTVADTCSNPTIAKIREWGEKRKGCRTETFRESLMELDTQLFYLKETVILTFSNGRQMSIVGTVGLATDDKFSAAIFNTGDARLEESKHNQLEESVEKMFEEAEGREKVIPLSTQLEYERRKKECLEGRLTKLAGILPVPDADVLSLEAAPEAVGDEYISKCQKAIAEGKSVGKEFDVSHIDFEDDYDEIMKNGLDGFARLEAQQANEPEESVKAEDETDKNIPFFDADIEESEGRDINAIINSLNESEKKSEPESDLFIAPTLESIALDEKNPAFSVFGLDKALESADSFAHESAPGLDDEIMIKPVKDSLDDLFDD